MLRDMKWIWWKVKIYGVKLALFYNDLYGFITAPIKYKTKKHVYIILTVYLFVLKPRLATK